MPRLLAALALPLLFVPTAIPQQKVDPDHATKMAKGTDLFKASVRGILQAKCVKCHSGEKVEGEFDMGTRESLLRGGQAGTGVVPGDAKKSLLYQLVAHLKAPHMPHERAKLPDADIARIAEWIDLGAPYDKPFLEKDDATAWTRKVVPADAKKHWAFQPLARIPRDTIDSFLRAKFDAAGIKPAPPADKRTLVRRVYLDLVGLPPTPEQVAAFLKDDSPGGFEKVVDDLLASPRYGERWARHWLDLVRFAESHGFEHDYDRPTAYHYRDFVIKALNQDMPFDTFARWQLAGDELAPNDNLALAATGYLAAGVHSTQITKSEVEKHRYDELDDMLANVGTTFLGLTVGCARCHDHKFDAIPARDYYRMLSAFTTTVRSEVELDTDPEGYKNAKAAFDAAHMPFADALTKFEKEQLPAAFAKWEAARGDKPLSLDGWVLPTVTAMKSAGGATLTKQDDGSVLVSGKNPTTETLTFTLTTDAVGVAALRVEALPDASLIRNGPGRATNGNFALSDLKVTASAPKGTPERVKLLNPRATFEQKGLPVAAAIDPDATSAWAVDPQFGKAHAAAFDFEKPVGFEGGTTFVVTLSFHNNTGHGMGRPRFSLSTADKPVLTSPATTEAVRAALAVPAAKRTPVQKSTLLKWYAPQDAGYLKVAKAAADHMAKVPKSSKVKALIASEGLPPIRLHSQGDDFLKETHFLRRGDTAQKEGTANVSFLQVLMPDAESQGKWLKSPPAGSRTSHRRVAFAEWMTDVETGAGGLAARVVVNRLWQHHFGRGIVATPSDFGVRGELPSHPDLLDFLANELVKGGWKLKPLHKQMVLSAAYQQASKRDDKADPENKLFSRFPVRRLEAEVIRDSILAAGGTLEVTMYGPGTLDEASKRRSVYFTMKRSKQIAALGVFDAPDGTAGVGERPSTTIAPQALHLMNNPHVRAAATGLAKRASDGAKTDADAVTQAYQLALCREPTKEELADGVAFVKGGKEALADFCQVLFCLNEFLYTE